MIRFPKRPSDKASPVEKITRDAFLYFDPKGDKKRFAQCATCMMWTGDKGHTCTIIGQDFPVHGVDSCGVYVHGSNHEDMIGKEMALVTPKEVGFYRGKVRCENCKYLPGKETCELYVLLNRMMPEIFDLDTKVDPHGCCNGFMSDDAG